MYTYTDPLGRRKFIYANDLATLREKEKQLMKDQLDGLDVYVAGKATVNDTRESPVFTICLRVSLQFCLARNAMSSVSVSGTALPFDAVP